MMTQQTVAGRANSVLTGARGTAPEFAVRFVGALLAVTVATVHVADQGASPPWYRRPGSAGGTGSSRPAAS